MKAFLLGVVAIILFGLAAVMFFAASRYHHTVVSSRRTVTTEARRRRTTSAIAGAVFCLVAFIMGVQCIAEAKGGGKKPDTSETETFSTITMSESATPEGGVSSENLPETESESESTRALSAGGKVGLAAAGLTPTWQSADDATKSGDDTKATDDDDISSEDAVPDVSKLINLKEIEKDDILKPHSVLGEHSKYWSRTGMVSMAQERSKRCGFENAVDLPFFYQQEMFDRGTKYGRDGEVSKGQTIDEMVKELEQKIKQLPLEEQYSAYRWQTYDDIVRKPQYCDMAYQMFRENPYVLKNNQELVDRWFEYYDKFFDPQLLKQNEIGKKIVNIGLDNCLEYEKGYEGQVNHLILTKEYQEFAYSACVILEFYHIKGIYAWESIANWQLPIPPEADTRLIRTELTTDPELQENGLAVIYEYRVKTGDGEGKLVSVFGVNLKDRRFELYGKKTAPPAKVEETTTKGAPKKTVTTPPTQGTTANPPTQTTTTAAPPEETPTAGPPPETHTNPPETQKPPETTTQHETPPPTTAAPKNPNNDPVHSGDADKLGGDNQEQNKDPGRLEEQAPADKKAEESKAAESQAKQEQDDLNKVVQDQNGGKTDGKTDGTVPSTEKADSGTPETAVKQDTGETAAPDNETYGGILEIPD